MSLGKRLTYCLITIFCGLICGIQGFFHVLNTRGLFHNQCSSINSGGGDTNTLQLFAPTSTSHHHEEVSHHNAAFFFHHFQFQHHHHHHHQFPLYSLISSTFSNSSSSPSPPPISSSYICAEQQHATAFWANIALGLLGLLQIIIGIIIDVMGAKRSAILFTILWTIATCISGIHPESGVAWSLGMCGTAVASTGIVVTILVNQMPKACASPQQTDVWSSALTGCWDAGSAAAVLLSFLYGIQTIPLWGLYGMQGIVIGAPVLIFFVCQGNQPQRVNNDDVIQSETGDGAEGEDHNASRLTHASTIVLYALEEPNVHGSEKGNKFMSVWSKLKQSAQHGRRAILSGPIYVALVLTLAFSIVVGNFMIAAVGSFAKWHGANDQETQAMRQIFSICVGAGSIGSLVPGKFMQWAGHFRQGLYLTLLFQLILFSGFASVALFVPTSCSIKIQYVGMVLLSIWRACGFSIANVGLIHVFGVDAEAIGSLTGLAYTTASTISILVGAPTLSVVQRDVDKFQTLIIVLWISYVGGAVFLWLSVRWMSRKRIAEVKKKSDSSSSNFVSEEVRRTAVVACQDDGSGSHEKTRLIQ